MSAVLLGRTADVQPEPRAVIAREQSSRTFVSVPGESNELKERCRAQVVRNTLTGARGLVLPRRFLFELGRRGAPLWQSLAEPRRNGEGLVGGPGVPKNLRARPSKTECYCRPYLVCLPDAFPV